MMNTITIPKHTKESVVTKNLFQRLISIKVPSISLFSSLRKVKAQPFDDKDLILDLEADWG